MSTRSKVWTLVLVGALLILVLKWRDLKSLNRQDSLSHRSEVGQTSQTSPSAPSPLVGAFRPKYHEDAKLRAYNDALENAVHQSEDQPLKEMLLRIDERMPNTWRDTFVFRDAYNAVIGISALKKLDQFLIDSNAEHINGIGALSGNPETERYLKAINDDRRTLSAHSLETFKAAMANRLSTKYPEFERGEWMRILDIDYAAPAAPLGPFNLVSAKDIATHFGVELLPPPETEKRGVSIDEARRLTEPLP